MKILVGEDIDNAFKPWRHHMAGNNTDPTVDSVADTCGDDVYDRFRFRLDFELHVGDGNSDWYGLLYYFPGHIKIMSDTAL